MFLEPSVVLSDAFHPLVHPVEVDPSDHLEFYNYKEPWWSSRLTPSFLFMRLLPHQQQEGFYTVFTLWTSIVPFEHLFKVMKLHEWFLNTQGMTKGSEMEICASYFILLGRFFNFKWPFCLVWGILFKNHSTHKREETQYQKKKPQ